MPPRAFRNEKKNEFRDHLVDDDGAFFVKLNYFRSLDTLKIFGGVWSFCRTLPKNHWLDSSRRRLKDGEKNEKGKRPKRAVLSRRLSDRCDKNDKNDDISIK